MGRSARPPPRRPLPLPPNPTTSPRSVLHLPRRALPLRRSTSSARPHRARRQAKGPRDRLGREKVQGRRAGDGVERERLRLGPEGGGTPAAKAAVDEGDGGVHCGAAKGCPAGRVSRLRPEGAWGDKRESGGRGSAGGRPAHSRLYFRRLADEIPGPCTCTTALDLRFTSRTAACAAFVCFFAWCPERSSTVGADWD